ncbi:MAG: HNH endonuclease [Thermodesulfobacteriota bacterium]
MSWYILKEFKNRFNLARKVVNKISQPGISFKLSYEEGKGAHASLRIPDEKKMARFVTAVSAFATPTSTLNIRNIAAVILDDLTLGLSDSEVEKLKDWIQKIENGPVRLGTEGKISLSGLELYLAYAKGEYFNEEEDSVEKISGFRKYPVLNPLLVAEFYSYSYDVYKLCGYIYFLIRKAEITNKPVGLKSSKTKEPQCIYCKTKDGKFESEEHVYPESLGNREIILPPGSVCDSCNNNVLSALDNYFVNHDMISYLRVFNAPWNPRTGNFIKARHQNASVEATAPRKVSINIYSNTKDGFKEEEVGDETKITFNMTGKRFDPKKLGGSLYKIALGIICWQNGVEIALDNKYDLARNYILGSDKAFQNNLLISSNCTPTSHIEGEHIIGSPGTVFAISIFGVIFIFNLETEPIIQSVPGVKRHNFKCHPLS